ncbi:MAG: rhodanese-like domain-containing protein [Pseudomonadota bacterium]
MELFFEFASQQWIIFAALAVAIGMLVFHESQKAGPTVSPQQAINLINAEDGVFVDLRDASDFKQGHIVDAVNIPFSKITDGESQLNTYRQKPVVLVCKMGQHSGAAGKQLRSAGFEKVYKMAGGMLEWTNMQLPTVRS